MNEVTEKVFEYIDALAQKLGIASEYVFEALVKQAFIGGIVTLFIFAIFVLLTVGLLVWGYKWMMKASRDGLPDFHASYILLIVGGFLAIIMLAALGVTLEETIMKIVNPEYYAIKEILEAFK